MKVAFAGPTAVLVALVVMGFTSAAGQPRQPGSNGALSPDDVKEVIARLEKSTGAFADDLDDELDKSALDRTYRERELNKKAEDLEDALDEVRDEYEDGEDFTAYVKQALAAALSINGAMLDHRFSDKLEREWEALRRDLNVLANACRITPLRDP